MDPLPPKSNLLLAALGPGDYARLRPHLTQVRLEQQAVLQEPANPIEHIHFPLEGMVSLVAVMETGEAIEIAAIGREGAIGTKVGLQPQLAFAKAMVQLPGTALRIELDKFQQAARESLAITHLATCAQRRDGRQPAAVGRLPRHARRRGPPRPLAAARPRSP